MSNNSFKTWQQALETETKPVSDPVNDHSYTIPLLTILWHSDWARVGECCWLPQLAEGQPVALSRLSPDFSSVGSASGRPLGEPRLSRKPFQLKSSPEGISISTIPGLSPLEIDGELLESSRTLSEAELEKGVGLLLAGRVALLLHRRAHVSRDAPEYGLVGESASIWQLRHQIKAVSDLDTSVLIRGESGTGKEMVSDSIQASSARSRQAYLTVNMAAIPPALAASELFGVVRGAFSGADRSRDGYFKKAHDGTLFLDEIGETPPEIQALLLRALESGEIQPVGGDRPKHVNVRVIAATDANLEVDIAQGSFAGALLQRLRTFEIQLSPLRQRIEDLGRLFLFFLRMELRTLGLEEKMEQRGPYGRPFVSARLVARLAQYDWPGNVRELRNEIRQLAVTSREADTLSTGSWLNASSAPATKGASIDSRPIQRPEKMRRPNESYRDPDDITEDEMIDALAENEWNIKGTAAALGLSRASLYNRVSKSERVRKAKDLEAAEIREALEQHLQSVEAAAKALRVSKQGLKRQMQRLKIT